MREGISLDKFFRRYSRIKLTLIGCALIFIEALIRAAWPSFPFIEAMGGEITLIGGCIGLHSFQEYKTAKLNGQKPAPPAV